MQANNIVEMELIEAVRNHCDVCVSCKNKGRVIGCTRMCETVENVVEQLFVMTGQDFDHKLRCLIAR